MKRSLPLGRLSGVPVGAHWSTVVILLLITVLLAVEVLPGSGAEAAAGLYWVTAAGAAVLFLAALLAHELAHAVTARRRGVRVRSVTLFALGGVTEFEAPAATPRAEFVIAAAGPLTSLVAGVLFWLAAVAASLATAPVLVLMALSWLAGINVLLAVFNLLPGAPLDGGRVLHAALWWRFGERARADRATSRAGEGLGLGLVFAGLAMTLVWARVEGLWLVLVGWFLSTAARGEAAAGDLRDGLGGLRLREVMTPDPAVAAEWLTVEECVRHLVLESRQTVFPTVDFDGRPSGYVTLETLRDVPAERRPEVRLREVARRLPEQGVQEAGADATGLLEAGTPGRELVRVVVEGGRVVGMVTSADLSRVIRQAPLRRAARPPSFPGPPSAQP
ncbi:site-2 protease family protein [Marinactinospora rubrisoli]|uniref:Zinc metalloprotease n=1 Tax=Marinactinospora rubrisoli TaxID=2715399 RepID=A0ABW2KHU1_9ACTN